MKKHIGTLALSLGLSGVMAMAALPASAQTSYPSERSIRMIIPLAAGSAVDKAARVVTQHMSTTLGQSIVVENLPGASGLIGAEKVAKADPDGYTMAGSTTASSPWFPTCTRPCRGIRSRTSSRFPWWGRWNGASSCPKIPPSRARPT